MTLSPCIKVCRMEDQPDGPVRCAGCHRTMDEIKAAFARSKGVDNKSG